MISKNGEWKESRKRKDTETILSWKVKLELHVGEYHADYRCKVLGSLALSGQYCYDMPCECAILVLGSTLGRATLRHSTGVCNVRLPVAVTRH